MEATSFYRTYDIAMQIMNLTAPPASTVRTLLSFLVIFINISANAADSTYIRFQADSWTTKNEVKFTKKEAFPMGLMVGKGSAVLNDFSFKNGTIEFDILMNPGISTFIFRWNSDESKATGFRPQTNPDDRKAIVFKPQTNSDEGETIPFRPQSDTDDANATLVRPQTSTSEDKAIDIRPLTNTGEGEAIVFRPQTNCAVSNDCMRYSPVTHGAFRWNLFPQSQTQAPLAEKMWNHVKIVVLGRRMNVYLNRLSKPILMIKHMEGSLLDGTFRLSGPASWANLIITRDGTEGLGSGL